MSPLSRPGVYFSYFGALYYLMPLSLESVPRRSSKVVFRKIENEYILVPLLSTTEEAESIFNLNEIGAVIWEKVDGGKSIAGIIDELCREYDADADTIRKDVYAFINDLQECSLLELT
ncbi:MAG: pyrroloquinoline quinone biosynthesis peptide chaperone PqqD [Nitrospiraceae bacterium]|nr:pyrroloquinoline quinone biosynthesis peptide chaperone PqqD [Nitrospiraceae bacterium]